MEKHELQLCNERDGAQHKCPDCKLFSACVVFGEYNPVYN
jgi:hypothetical protein